MLWHAIQYKATETLFFKNFDVVIANNGVPSMNSKGFMVENAQANWNIARKVYRRLLAAWALFCQTIN